ncbi:hypothetical protein [Kribbella sp. NPDC050459]|uniref:hypothetical protein n=1 Tax=Kribbella sp. NPDC050459 TaxID=3155785 RepID=UPI0033D35C22
MSTLRHERNEEDCDEPRNVGACPRHDCRRDPDDLRHRAEPERPMTATQLPLPTDRRVRVWFGEHLIADYVSDPESATAYEVAMSRRFVSLRETNDPALFDAADS